MDITESIKNIAGNKKVLVAAGAAALGAAAIYFFLKRGSIADTTDAKKPEEKSVTKDLKSSISPVAAINAPATTPTGTTNVVSAVNNTATTGVTAESSAAAVGSAVVASSNTASVYAPDWAAPGVGIIEVIAPEGSTMKISGPFGFLGPGGTKEFATSTWDPVVRFTPVNGCYSQAFKVYVKKPDGSIFTSEDFMLNEPSKEYRGACAKRIVVS